MTGYPRPARYMDPQPKPRFGPARSIVAAENKRLREALQQYANKKLWSEDGQFMDCKNDEGAEIARIALLKQED